ncbi:MAG: AMP-binding protein, partial [Pyrinomonadaceae bacterium]
MSESFCKMLIASFEQRPDKIAMRVVGSDDEVYTFAEMLNKIRSVAYRLGQEKVEFGDRVALIGENHPSWAIAYLGTLYHGAVIVPMDPHGEIETITNFLKDSEAKIVFLSPDQIERYQEIQKKLGQKIPAVVWEVEASPDDSEKGTKKAAAKSKPESKNKVDSTKGFQNFKDWSSTKFPESFAKEMPKAEGDDMALLMYTSGTTGTPKGVPLTHGNIVGELSGVNDVLKLSDKERILSLLPLFHAYLQVINLWVAATYGPQVGYLTELTPAELSSSMKAFKPTILSTVPRLWYLFHKKIFDAVDAKPIYIRALFRTMLAANGVSRNVLNVNLGPKLFGEVHKSFGGKLRIAISAGSRFDQAVAADFHNLGFTIIQGYGLTETSGAATATPENDNRVGSVGKPMKGAEIKIDKPNKEGVGEVLIRGTVVFAGYYGNKKATDEAFTKAGWFRTGDLGRVDSDGFLYIVGRGKDVIVLPSGKNVHPEDIEAHYLKCPLVEELAVIGIEEGGASRAGTEKLAAVVVPDFAYLKKTGVANSKEAIRHALDDLGRSLPEYSRVRDYMIRAEPLPKTATNKVKRFQLKEEIESGKITADDKAARTWELSGDDSRLLESSAAKAVVAIIKNNSQDADVIHPGMSLEIDLGLDSLARAEVFAGLEHALSAHFPDEEASQALTVGEVIALVEKRAGDIDDSKVISTELNWSEILEKADARSSHEIRPVLKSRPIFNTFSFAVYKCFWLIFKLFLRLEVKGLENLDAAASGVSSGVDDRSKENDHSPKQSGKASNGDPRSGFLICPNHQSFLDPFVICSNYPYRVFKDSFHVGASEFFDNAVTRFIAKMLNIVPVNPDTELMRAMKASAVGLKNGKALNIYPEGERAFDGELHEFKKGASILA